MTPDEQSLEQLARSGSDLEQLHQFEFTLRFPTQKAAERAELELLGLAFDTRQERGRSVDEWLLRGTKRMYPVESDLRGLRDKLDAIAAAGKGTYVGWTARVFVRKPGG